MASAHMKILFNLLLVIEKGRKKLKCLKAEENFYLGGGGGGGIYLTAF